MASERRAFPCNTCSITFPSSALQRSHMRQPWHIQNLRSRVAGLPAVSEGEYSASLPSQTVVPRPIFHEEPEIVWKSSDQGSAELGSKARNFPWPAHGSSAKAESTQCLFCPLSSSSLATNVHHMSSLHGLFIPSPDRLSDLESFLGYLATVVFEFNECLYCGLSKGAVDSVQTHMRDKGHCKLPLNADSELLEFWDSADDDDDNDGEINHAGAAIDLSHTEMRLPSGAVARSRSGLVESRRQDTPRRGRRAAVLERRGITAEQIQETSEARRGASTPSGNDRRIAIRGEMGIAGLSESAKRALQVTEMKMRRREIAVSSAKRHAVEQEPVKTKYYKTEAPIYQAG